MKSHTFTTRAFTLIELLVVISIVSLLISILLPALASARKSAQGVKCLTNLRQNLLAGLSYANDYNQVLTTRQTSTTGPGNWTWTQLLYNGQYNQIRQSMYCPMDAPASLSWVWTYACLRTSTYSDSDGWPEEKEVVMPVKRIGSTDYGDCIHLDAVRKTDKVWYIMDSWNDATGSGSEANNQIWSIGASASSSSGAALRHSKAAQAAFIDGHAAAQGPDDLKLLYITKGFDMFKNKIAF